MKEMQIISKSQDEKADDENSMNSPEYEKHLFEEIKNYEKLSDSIKDEITIKDSKYYKEKIKKLKKPISIFIGFGLSYFLYFLSLESCFDGEGPCTGKYNWIKLKIIEAV